MNTLKRKRYYQSWSRVLMLTALPFVPIAFASVGCSQSDCDECNDVPCNSRAKTVKAVADEAGIVTFDSTINQWVILVSIDGTYDSRDAGIVCNDLSDEFKEVGKWVIFSGEYKKYAGELRPAFPGQVYYYLFISNINTPQDE